MKKILIISLCLISLLLTGCGCEKKEEKNDENKIAITQTVNEIEFSNANISYENDMSTFRVIVTNKSNSGKTIGIVSIIVKDKDNNELVTLKGLIEKELKPNTSTSITASVGVDLSNAYSVEYSFK